MERAVVLGRLRKALEFPPEFGQHPSGPILKPLLQVRFYRFRPYHSIKR